MIMLKRSEWALWANIKGRRNGWHRKGRRNRWYRKGNQQKSCIIKFPQCCNSHTCTNTNYFIQYNIYTPVPGYLTASDLGTISSTTLGWTSDDSTNSSESESEYRSSYMILLVCLTLSLLGLSRVSVCLSRVYVCLSRVSVCFSFSIAEIHT